MERKSPMITGISAGDARSRIFKAIQPTVSTKAHTIDTASVVTPAAAHRFCLSLKSITATSSAFSRFR